MGKDLDGCPNTVRLRVRCRGSGKGNQKIRCDRERDYNTPEWTIHSHPLLPGVYGCCRDIELVLIDWNRLIGSQLTIFMFAIQSF
jgi:hypothetical protein